MNPFRRNRQGKAARATVGLLAAVGVALAACSPAEEPGETGGDAEADFVSTDHFGYQVNKPLLTTNAGSAIGASVNAHLIAGRLYPAVYVPGPSGQMIPNTDLLSAQSLPGPQRQVVYTLNEDATFSDGTPVTCVDFLLAQTAGQMDALFDSHMPLMNQIDRMDCDLGDRQFTTVYDQGDGGRWRQVFGPGTVLPAHAIAREAGVSMEDLVPALHRQDADALAEVARVWREGFSLENFNPDLQVSFGPFTVGDVGPDGEVVLERNEHYMGDDAELETLVVWPADADSAALADAGALKIADVPTADVGWVDRDDPTNPYAMETVVGTLTESLTMSETGVLGQQWARQAFAACVDQGAVAAASSRVSGVEVPPVTVHVVEHQEPVADHLNDVAGQYAGVDVATASGLWGTTIRIGYRGPDERKAAMVEAIAESCAPAGITVVDASEEGSTIEQLGSATVGQWGETIAQEGAIDAYLGAVDPMSEYGAVSVSMSDVERLRESEEALWEELPVLPLSAQPRIFVIHESVGNVVVHTGLAGIGWNMDRWQVSSEDTSNDDDVAATETEQVQ